MAWQVAVSRMQEGSLSGPGLGGRSRARRADELSYHRWAGAGVLEADGRARQPGCRRADLTVDRGGARSDHPPLNLLRS